MRNLSIQTKILGGIIITITTVVITILILCVKNIQELKYQTRATLREKNFIALNSILGGKKQFLDKANKSLTERGELMFCYEAKRFDDIIKLLPNPLKIIDVQFVYPKKDKLANLVMIRAKRHSKSMLKFHSPIFNFDETDFSAKAKQIYQKANTISVKE